MLPNYQFYLDGTLLVDEPTGWDTIEDKIERVDELNGLFVTLNIKMTFNGDGYDYLFSKFANSFCGQVTFDIYEKNCDDDYYTSIYKGVINVPQLKVDYNKCLIDVPEIQDNSFYAKINNNKSIKTYVEVGKSKLGVAFNGARNYQFHPFNPCTGSDILVYDRHAVTVYEAFRSLVAFMTDDEVEFDSNFFAPAGAQGGLAITDGIHLSSILIGEYSELRNIEKFSFVDLFTEMNKKFHLGMMIDRSGVKPKLIIEQDSYFKNATSLLTMDNVKDVIASIDVERLFSQVRLGSDTIDGTGCGVIPNGLAFPRDSPFITFKDENYFVVNNCNIDKTLDLYSNWIIDTNKIQDMVVGASEDYDDQIVILETSYNWPGISTMIKGDPFDFGASSVVRFYNPSLMNSAVTQNYLGGIPDSIAQVLANVNDECLILRTQTNLITLTFAGTGIGNYSPVVFNNKTTPPYNDPGGNFTLATGRYTSVAVGGLYRFNLDFTLSYLLSNIPFSTGTLYVRAIFRHFDVTNAQIGPNNVIQLTYSLIPYVFPIVGIDYFYSMQSQMFSMAIGDYVFCEIEIEWPGVTLDPSLSLVTSVKGAVFSTIYTSNGGGSVISYDPDKYPAYRFDFTYPMSRSDFQKLLDQPNYAASLNVDGVNNFKGFIQVATRNRKTSLAKFTLIKSKVIE